MTEQCNAYKWGYSKNVRETQHCRIQMLSIDSSRDDLQLDWGVRGKDTRESIAWYKEDDNAASHKDFEKNIECSKIFFKRNEDVPIYSSKQNILENQCELPRVEHYTEKSWITIPPVQNDDAIYSPAIIRENALAP